MKVYILDIVGYDARGGIASVFSSLDRAKNSLNDDIEWEQDLNAKEPTWVEKIPNDSLRDYWEIREQELI